MLYQNFSVLKTKKNKYKTDPVLLQQNKKKKKLYFKIYMGAKNGEPGIPKLKLMTAHNFWK